MVDIDSLRRLAIRPGPSKRFLERAENGESFFPFIDTAWEIFHRLTKEEVLEYLDKRQGQGFNGIMGVLVPELDVKGHGSRHYQGEMGPDGTVIPPAREETVEGREAEFGGSAVFYPNRFGHVPFDNDDPMRPNEDYFAHVDWVIDQAAMRGILVWLVPTWSRFVSTGWADGPILFNEKNARTYGAFLGERYPFLPKLIGGDSNPDWVNGLEARTTAAVGISKLGEKLDGVDLPSPYDLERHNTAHIWNELARGILETETRFWGTIGRPFLTYHPCPVSFPWEPPATASDFFGKQDWLLLDGFQSGHADFERLHFDPPIRRWNARASHEALTWMWRAEPTRPIIDLESHYEEAHNGLVNTSGYAWDVNDIRSGAWQSVLSGACGIVYGCNVIWQMYDPELFKAAPFCFPVCGTSKCMSWKQSIHLPGPKHLRHMVEYFASLPRSILDHRRPAQDCLVNSEIPSDRRDTDGRIDVMRDLQPGQRSSTWLIAHSGMGYEFELDLSVAFGQGTKLIAQWMDPRTGVKQNLGEIVLESSVRFVPPSKAEDKPTDDWVLILASQ